MKDDDLKLLLQSLGAQILGPHYESVGALSVLFSETVRFRDQLKNDTGVTLTVADTRAALDALEKYLDTKQLPTKLSSEQMALAQLFIDRLTLFKRP